MTRQPGLRAADASQLGPAMDVRPLLRQLGLRPSRHRGQSFLVDGSVVGTILAEAELTKDDTVLEVGPGLGVLTSGLADRAGRVIAVEIEPRLAAHLRKSLAIFPNVQVIEGDILSLGAGRMGGGDANDWLALPRGYKVVANIPYAITSALLRHFLEAVVPPERLVLMVQKEVAQRVVAKPGRMSILAVSVQLYGEPRLVAVVPACSFYPVPQVDSAILRVDVLPQPRVVVEPRRFFRVVAAGFHLKRKQLKNALASGLALPQQRIAEILQVTGIDGRRRAETLSVEEWGILAEAVP